MLQEEKPTPLLPKAKEVGGGHMPGPSELRRLELRLEHSQRQHPAQKTPLSPQTLPHHLDGHLNEAAASYARPPWDAETAQESGVL